jgi:hypothetical protein
VQKNFSRRFLATRHYNSVQTQAKPYKSAAAPGAGDFEKTQETCVEELASEPGHGAF